jgi:RNA-directed DNA polymerase
VDGTTLAQFEANLPHNLQELAEELRRRTYQPLPLRRLMLPKDGGSRSVGVVAVRDRVVQRAITDLLEPVLDPLFLDCSYAYRPGRSSAMAVARVVEYQQNGLGCLVHGDIRDFFDSMRAETLLELLERHVKDASISSLISDWFAAASPVPESPEAPSSRSLRAAVSPLVLRLREAWPASMTDLLAPTGSAAGQRGERLRHLLRLAQDSWSLGRHRVRFRSPRFGRGPARLAAIAGGAVSVASLVFALRRRPIPSPGGTVSLQGTIIGPLLSNLYLHEFDQAMVRFGASLVRYADDFVIACRDADEAQRALAAARAALGRLGLELSEPKTSIVSFRQGVRFLGVQIGPYRRS